MGEKLSPLVENDPPIPPSSQVLGKTVAQLQGIWEELKLAGIQRNERTEKLALLPHITPDCVRGHRLQLEERGKRGARWSGLLITILESGDPAPPVSHRPNGHPGDCRCLDCQVWDAQERRYASPPAPCDPPEDEQAATHPRPDPSVELPVTPEGESALSVWEVLLDQLSREISTPAFVTWVSPSWLHAWDPPAGVFTVCAPDPYAREWLAQRMQSTISHALTGICARLVSVRFVDPSEIQEQP